MNSNYFLLNRVFTKNIFKDLVEKNCNNVFKSAIKKYIHNYNTKNNQQIFSEFYKALQNNYRNEYFYKNTLLNKLLLGIHSPKTTTVLSEISISKSKADFVLINGKAIVYEIKTELDTFNRLSSQIQDYYKAFNHVSVVTSEDNYKQILSLLSNTPVGIIILTTQNTLSVKKIPKTNNSQLDLDIIFKILHKKEYEYILKKTYGELPNVSQFDYFNTCKKLFCKLNKKIAYNYFLKLLKKRKNIDITEYKQVPKELKFLAYCLDFKKRDYDKLNVFLQNKFGG